MRTFILISLALCVLISLTSAIRFSKMRAGKEKQWKEYKKLFKKNYDEKEEARRKRIVKGRINAIRAHNAKYGRKESTYYMALTSVSDMTFAEYKKTLGFKPKKRSASQRQNIEKAAHARHPKNEKAAHARRPKRSSGNVPASMDLRSTGCIGPIRDQGDCGSCYAHAAIELLEYHYCRVNCGQTFFSIQQIVECSWSYYNLGCYGGHYDWVFDYLKDAGKICLMSDYPYIADDWAYCSSDSKPRVTLEGIGYTNLPHDEEEMKHYLAHEGPIAVGIDANENFQNYGGGIYSDDTCVQDFPTHAIVLVGYGTSSGGVDYWIAKNTNGPAWGEAGYVRIKRGVNTCGITYYPTGMHFTTGHTGYDCMGKSPCTPANLLSFQFYHPHISKCRYVQCGSYWGCWEMPCATGTVWSQQYLTCVHK